MVSSFGMVFGHSISGGVSLLRHCLESQVDLICLFFCHGYVFLGLWFHQVLLWGLRLVFACAHSSHPWASCFVLGGPGFNFGAGSSRTLWPSSVLLSLGMALWLGPVLSALSG